MINRTRCAFLLAVLPAIGAMGQPVNEYQMKAAYVYNLAKFVEWPAGTFKNPTDPISICVLGQSPVQTPLEEAVHGESIDDRKLIVRSLGNVQQATACHILFVAAAGHQHLRSVLRDIPASGLLTVGDTEGFLDDGAAVNFSLEGSRVRIDINISAVAKQGLRISPKLLSLARIVKK